MSPRHRARLLFRLDEPGDRRGGVILPLAVVVSLIAHLPAVPVLARMIPQPTQAKMAHFELLMESFEREAPRETGPRRRIAATPSTSSVTAAITMGTGLAELPREESTMCLGAGLSLQEKGPALPARPAKLAGQEAESSVGISKKWFAWYCKRLKEDIAEEYPFSTLARHNIEGEIRFRLEIHPDGRIRAMKVLKADHPMMVDGLRRALAQASPLPGYGELGLEWFPPLNMSIMH